MDSNKALLTTGARKVVVIGEMETEIVRHGRRVLNADGLMTR